MDVISLLQSGIVPISCNGVLYTNLEFLFSKVVKISNDCLRIVIDPRSKTTTLDSFFLSGLCEETVALGSNDRINDTMMLVFALSALFGCETIQLDDVATKTLPGCVFPLYHLRRFLPPFRSYYGQFGFMGERGLSMEIGNHEVATNKKEAHSLVSFTGEDEFRKRRQEIGLPEVNSATVGFLVDEISNLCKRSQEKSLRMYINYLTDQLYGGTIMFPEMFRSSTVVRGQSQAMEASSTFVGDHFVAQYLTYEYRFENNLLLISYTKRLNTFLEFFVH